MFIHITHPMLDMVVAYILCYLSSVIPANWALSFFFVPFCYYTQTESWSVASCKFLSPHSLSSFWLLCCLLDGGSTSLCLCVKLVDIAQQKRDERVGHRVWLYITVRERGGCRCCWVDGLLPWMLNVLIRVSLSPLHTHNTSRYFAYLLSSSCCSPAALFFLYRLLAPHTHNITTHKCRLLALQCTSLVVQSI